MAYETIRIRVPGKWMIAGEYAVLAPGGVALAVAVKPGMVVQAESSQEWALHRADTGASWTEGEVVSEAFRFAHGALGFARKSMGADVLPARFITRLDPVLNGGSEKVGVGGSAATVVGILDAAYRWAGRTPDRDRLIREAVEVHTDLQGGRGSGYDVATICMGGLVRWDREMKNGESISWPEGLYCLGGYVGQGAHTPSLISRVEDAAVSTAGIQEVTGNAVEAFRKGVVTDILGAIDACQEAFRVWNQKGDLGLWTSGLERMSQVAKEEGAIVRVSGAGGGDTLLVFADNADTLIRVSDEWEKAGFTPLPYSFTDNGPHLVA